MASNSQNQPRWYYTVINWLYVAMHVAKHFYIMAENQSLDRPWNKENQTGSLTQHFLQLGFWSDLGLGLGIVFGQLTAKQSQWSISHST